MKAGLRFIDTDMHIMEPWDVLDRCLDKRFRHRVSVPMDKDGRPRRGVVMIDGLRVPPATTSNSSASAP
jgi:hypothetical protein